MENTVNQNKNRSIQTPDQKGLSNLSQKVLFGVVFVLGVVITLLLLKQQQDLRQQATGNTVVQAVCSGSGTVDVTYTYRNNSSSDQAVNFKDTQSGETVNLGVIGAGGSVSGKFNTNKKSISAGTLEFIINGEKIVVGYAAFSCEGSRTCEVREARCTWDAATNATEYKVVVKDAFTGEIIRQGKVSHPTTEFVFPAEAGKRYSCDVTAVNNCGRGPKGTGEGACPAPTATPMPTATPTPIPGACGFKGCSTTNPCDSGLVCIQARNGGGSYCAMPSYQTSCADNPSTSTCCTAPSPTPTATPGPSSVFQSPICQSLSIDRSTSGIAPYAVTFTAVGHDNDGVITKAQFNFGDGPVVTETVGGGLGTGTINLQKSHTYTKNGTYTATVTFIDNQNYYSADTCKVTLTLGSGGGTPNTPPGSSPTPPSVGSNSPFPTRPGLLATATTTPPAIGSNSPFPTQPGHPATATPTPLKALPPTGGSNDVVTMTVVGSAIALIGSFVVIFLW